MSRKKKKSRKQDKALQTILLLTAIIQLINAVLDLVEHFS